MTNNSKTRNLIYQNYFKQPVQMVELNLTLIYSKNPRLMNALDITFNQA